MYLQGLFDISLLILANNSYLTGFGFGLGI